MQIRVDTTGDVPSPKACRNYRIRSMGIKNLSDVVELTLEFDGALAREDALHFLKDWMHSDDPEDDLEVALS
jgi:hypothetical protein